MERTPLTPDAIAAALRDLPTAGSCATAACTVRSSWPTSAAAFAFMTRVAFEAEDLNHHPDWSNVWNRVMIDLSTHSAGGVTEFDVELARRISTIAD